MQKRRFRVLMAFPIWRRKEAAMQGSAAESQKWDGMAKMGEIFELEKSTSKWEEVGFAYFRTDLPRVGPPDFSGAHLHWLLKLKYIEELPNTSEKNG